MTFEQQNAAWSDTPLGDSRSALGWPIQLAVFFISFAILVSRRPDAILNAQFYAEDGARWFADAYHFGWRCLLLPDSGYLQTASRLVGLLAQAFPFVMAPLVMNVCALVVQILPVNLFLSSTWKAIPLYLRISCSLLYLALPNSFEVHANTTNMQWHLALVGLLILLGKYEESWVWRGFALSALALGVLDGAAGVLLVVVAVPLLVKRRGTFLKAAAATLACGSLLQAGFLFFSHSRRPAPNGAGLLRLVGILGGQVFLSSILGVRTFIKLFFDQSQYLLLAEVVALCLGFGIVAYACCRAPLELRLFLLYAAVALTLALIHPVATYGGTAEQWQQMQTPGVGNRYYFFPMLAFLGSLVWSVTPQAATKGIRYFAVAILLLSPVGIWRDWKYKPFNDLRFKEHAVEFDRAAPGTTVVIPINPNWQLVLVKH